MKDNSLFRLGGWCAILLGIVGILADITYVLLPADQRLGVPAAKILPSIAQGSTLLNLQFLELTLLAILGLAAVPAISEMFRSGHEGWVRWTSNLAMLGYAVSAVSSFFTFGRLPNLAKAFAAGDPSTQAALIPVWRSTFDLHGLWGYGMVGVWVLVISLIALQGTRFPKGLSYLGVVLGICYGLIPAAFVFKLPALFLVAAIPAGIVHAAWYLWTGVVTRRYEQSG
jgi:Domain of unknown function (DUF4386)